MRRWAGVGIVGWAAAAAVLAMVKGGVRADDDEDKSRQVEIVRFAGGGARLGVVLEDVGADDVARLKLPEERGAVVKEVVKGSAAEKAGLKEEDVILSYQGERVGSAAQLRRLVRETPGGRRVAIEASRAGAAQRLTATLASADEHELALGDDNSDLTCRLLPLQRPSLPFRLRRRSRPWTTCSGTATGAGGSCSGRATRGPAAWASPTRRSRASWRATSRSRTGRCSWPRSRPMVRPPRPACGRGT